MAARVRIIDPDTVVTIDDWYKYYRRKYTNLRTDGATYMVLDADDTVVKTLVPPQGRDYIAVLANPGSSEELRVAALGKRDNRIQARAATIEQARNEFADTERAVLSEVDVWTASETTDARIAAAHAVAAATQIALATNAAYVDARGVREVQVLSEDAALTRRQLDSATRDDRKLRMDVYRTLWYSDAPIDRIIATDTA